MADQVFPFLKSIGPLKDFMTKLKWDSKSQVSKITVPTLYISGSKDTFVPTWMTHMLHKCTTNAEFK